MPFKLHATLTSLTANRHLQVTLCTPLPTGHPLYVTPYTSLPTCRPLQSLFVHRSLHGTLCTSFSKRNSLNATLRMPLSVRQSPHGTLCTSFSARHSLYVTLRKSLYVYAPAHAHTLHDLHWFLWTQIIHAWYWLRRGWVTFDGKVRDSEPPRDK